MSSFELTEFTNAALERYSKLVWAIARGESQLSEDDLRDTLIVLGKPLTDLEIDVKAARDRIALVGRLKALESEAEKLIRSKSALSAALAERDNLKLEYESKLQALDKAVDDARGASRQFNQLSGEAVDARRQLQQGASPAAKKRLAELEHELGKCIAAQNTLQSYECSEIRRQQLQVALAEAEKHKQEHTIDTAKIEMAAFNERFAHATAAAALYDECQRFVDDLVCREMLTEECLALPSLASRQQRPALSPQEANLIPYPDNEPELAGAVLQP